MLHRCFRRATSSRLFYLSRPFSASTKDSETVTNENIQYPSLRVVYNNPETDKPEWKILSRQDALQFARSFDLDLVLVDAMSTPPVCKLLDIGKKRLQQSKLKKEQSSKTKPMKEIFVGTNIGAHDLEVKLKRVKNFLQEGHQVKLCMTVQKSALAKNPQVTHKYVIVKVDSLWIEIGLKSVYVEDN